MSLLNSFAARPRKDALRPSYPKALAIGLMLASCGGKVSLPGSAPAPITVLADNSAGVAGSAGAAGEMAYPHNSHTDAGGNAESGVDAGPAGSAGSAGTTGKPSVHDGGRDAAIDSELNLDDPGYSASPFIFGGHV